MFIIIYGGRHADMTWARRHMTTYLAQKMQYVAINLSLRELVPKKLSWEFMLVPLPVRRWRDLQGISFYYKIPDKLSFLEWRQTIGTKETENGNSD